MLSEADLAGMQATQNGAMDLTGTRRRVAQTNDGHGGFTEAVTDVANIPCNLGNPSGETERVMASKLTDQAYWYLTVPVGTDVKNGDLWVIDGKVYRIIHVANAKSYLTATRCLVVIYD